MENRDPLLKEYRVTLREQKGDDFMIGFDCMAEDAEHAYEQAEDAYPGCILFCAMLAP
jgi:1,2-phenylacetyl-CoA epoxidase PaaB subunit